MLDLRHVNKCVSRVKFAMEDWRVFLQYICLNGYLKFDVKSGYHHVDICSEHTNF